MTDLREKIIETITDYNGYVTEESAIQIADAIMPLIEPQWRPIQTASRNGTKLFALLGREIRKVMYGKVSHVPIYGWILIDQGDEDADICASTHWMPLPQPPEASDD